MKREQGQKTNIRWGKLLFKDVFFQLSVESCERSLWQSISCMQGGSSSVPIPLAGIGFSSKLLVCGMSCCFELTGWLNLLLLSVREHMPSALARKPCYASKQFRYWYHQSLAEKDPAQPCPCSLCRCTASKTGEAVVPGKIKLPSTYIDKPVQFVVPFEAILGTSVPPSKVRLKWSYLNSCGTRSHRSATLGLDRCSSLAVQSGGNATLLFSREIGHESCGCGSCFQPSVTWSCR